MTIPALRDFPGDRPGLMKGKMMVLIENAVPVADVAKAMKVPMSQVEIDATRLQVFIGEDWAGRRAMSVTDAHGLVTGATRREQDQRTEWNAHLALSDQWEKDREAARSTAALDARRAAYSKGFGDPVAASEAREAGREAIEKFERAHPVPTIGGRSTSTNWFSGVVERVKEAVL